MIEEGAWPDSGMILIVEGGAYWRRATPDPVAPLNKGSLNSDLREFARRTVEGTLNGLLEEEADDLAGRGALGVCRGARSVLRRPLRPEPDDIIQRGHEPHAQAKEDALCDRDHRAPSAPRDGYRGVKVEIYPVRSLDQQDRKSRDLRGVRMFMGNKADAWLVLSPRCSLTRRIGATPRSSTVTCW